MTVSSVTDRFSNSYFQLTLGSDILETPPSFRISAGTLSRAITAQALKETKLHLRYKLRRIIAYLDTVQ